MAKQQTRAYGGSYQNPTGAITDYTAFSRGLASGIQPGLDFLKEQEIEKKRKEAEEKLRKEKEDAKIKLGASKIKTAQVKARDEAATAGLNVNKQLQIDAVKKRDVYQTATEEQRKFFDNFYTSINAEHATKLGLILGAYGSKDSDFDSFKNNVPLGTYIDKNNIVQEINHIDFIQALKEGKFTYEDNGKYNINDYKASIKYKSADNSNVNLDLSSINIEDVRENLTFKSDLQNIIKTGAGEVKNMVIKKPTLSADEARLGINPSVAAEVEELDDSEYNSFNHAFKTAYTKTPPFLEGELFGWDYKNSNSQNIINMAEILMKNNPDLTEDEAQDEASENIKEFKKQYITRYLENEDLVSSGAFIYDSNNKIIRRPVPKPEIDTKKLEQNQIRNLLESDLSSLNSANLVDNFKNRQYYVGDKIFQISDIQFAGPQNENKQRIRVYPIRVVNNAAIQYKAIVGGKAVNYIEVDLNNKNSIKTFMSNLYKDKSPNFLSILNNAINANIQANNNTKPKQGVGFLDNVGK